jgi:hypothetical protein
MARGGVEKALRLRRFAKLAPDVEVPAQRGAQQGFLDGAEHGCAHNGWPRLTEYFLAAAAEQGILLMSDISCR